jgi:exodeoxyribonuclease V alpha subunit
MSDPFEARLALAAPALLREFNEAGVLAPADVHVARRLCELAGEDDERVALAAALAVRAPRLGHVYADLATIRETAAVDADDPVDLSGLPWPDSGDLVAAASASELVATGDEPILGERPLRLVGSRLYLDRYWREERRIADDLLALRDRPPAAVEEGRLHDGLARMFGEDDSRQRLAAETAVRRRFAVVAGGPGTGKTTTVARILALLFEQAGEAPLVGLAAPTGKAADRLQQAIHEEAVELDVGDEVRTWLHGLGASTLHRLLGWRPGTHSRFRHHRGNRLPHDVVIVDETSMVSLSLMARLVEAVRPDARLVLVGDPAQLASIEAGAVLGDIVGPADAPGIVVLDRVHRYGGAIARVAEAIRRGDADGTVAALRDVDWVEDPDELRAPAVDSFGAVAAAAKAGAASDAIELLGAFRVLCAHRQGPYGVSAWTARVQTWLGEGVEGEWYAGRPLLVTENDYGLGLLNGDTGVTVADADGTLSAAFERRGEAVAYSPSRLAGIETVYAMTVHKSQGSQFATAAVVLPEPGSPLLTRELLYTAVTRARERLVVVGGEESVRAAVARPIARSSGLRERLWGSASVSPPR